MRRLAGFFFTAALAFAQIIGIPLPEVPNEVREYLGLTEEQYRRLGQREQSFWAARAELRETWAELQPRIVEETARSPLRPEVLGYLHASRERARRSYRAREIVWTRAATEILTTEQLGKLRVLGEWSGRGTWPEKATEMGLLPTSCSAPANPYEFVPEVCQEADIPMVTSIPDWTLDDKRAENRVSAEKYLGLTETQKQQFQENHRRIFANSSTTRMRQVAREIREELSKEVLDEAAIGVRYAEIEALRRRETELSRKLTADNTALLQPDQKLKLDAIREAMRLQWAVSDARSLPLLDGRCEDKGVLFLTATPFGMELFFYYLGDCPDKRAIQDLP